MKHTPPTALVILDGFGYRTEKEGNAIALAHTPHLDQWFSEYPHTILQASGPAVGLFPGMMGNSEVGHLTIGAGRVIEQPVVTIHTAIANKSLFKNEQLISTLKKVAQQQSALHIMGLLSDAGVHSDVEHLYAFLDAAHQHNVKHVYIHAFLDGRDTPPQSAAIYLEQLENAITAFGYGSLGSIHGRFYAMDRDGNWDRTQKSYLVLTTVQDTIPAPWQDVLEKQYKQGVTDEFIIPTQIDPTSTIQAGDAVIFFNLRPDRARQLTSCFVEQSFNHFPRTHIPLTSFITPVAYSPTLNTTVLFPTQPIHPTLKELLSKAGKTLFSIAETEKYAHVTYFFGGGTEKPFPHETQMLIPSIKARNYVEHPEMSAPQITDAVITSLQNNPADFYLINYANADMVGHSGNVEATIKAIECLDRELGRLYKALVQERNGTLYITADHGNAEQMIDAVTHQPHTRHTTNPVPFIVIKMGAAPKVQLPLKELSDIAAFILQDIHVIIRP
ncbi:MAG: 2,3-bisphosphoglycerate-independent phosphoglycerate mutase [Candidatus Babeliales bacterium]